jgi:hypothetical protein
MEASHTVLVRVDEPEVVLGDILDVASELQRPIAIIGPHTALSIQGKGTSTKSQHDVKINSGYSTHSTSKQWNEIIVEGSSEGWRCEGQNKSSCVFRCWKYHGRTSFMLILLHLLFILLFAIEASFVVSNPLRKSYFLNSQYSSSRSL